MPKVGITRAVLLAVAKRGHGSADLHGAELSHCRNAAGVQKRQTGFDGNFDEGGQLFFCDLLHFAQRNFWAAAILRRAAGEILRTPPAAPSACRA